MKKSIQIVLFAGIATIIFISAAKDKKVNETLNGKTENLAVDYDPTGCWARDTGSNKEILAFHFLIDTGPHKHFFYLENFIELQCPGFPQIVWPGASQGIGIMDGFRFSYALFTDQDTTFFKGLITDTITGQKQLELYSKTDTTVFFGE